MKVLLLGEFSNVHWTLAEGLRELGHQVTVISDGDGWKDYARDITLKRTTHSLPETCRFLARLLHTLPQMRGYDVVQLINPVFLPLKAERMFPIYNYLRKHNRSVFLGAFGMDHFWVKAGLDCHTFRYSDFNIGQTIRTYRENAIWIADWLKGRKGELNKYIADDCDGIVSGLYEYDASYRPYYNDKLRFIPFPIKCNASASPAARRDREKVRFFIGIQKARNEYKGTDIMLRALRQIERKWHSQCEVVCVESVPFQTYQSLMDSCDIILDQLYSYTPAMNALQAMSKGLVVVGGGEPENYQILHEEELRPIINVLPYYEAVYDRLDRLMEEKERIPSLSEQSIRYILKHHEYRKVAGRYVDFWSSRLPK